MSNLKQSECERCHGRLQYCHNPEAPGPLQIWETCGLERHCCTPEEQFNNHVC